MRKHRSRGEGSIYPRYTRLWAKYSTPQGPVRTPTPFHVGEERRAERWLKDRLAEVRCNIHRDVHNLRYEDLRDAYLEDFKEQQRKSLRVAEDGHLYTDATNRLDRFFSGMKAVDINVDVIRQFRAEQTDIEPGTVNRCLSCLRRMFNLAKEEERLRDVPYFPMAAENPPRQGFAEIDDYQRVLNTLPSYLHAVWAIAYWTGLRRSEILRLEWEDVDLVQGTIRLWNGETKNGEGRIVPICASLRPVLLTQWQRKTTEFVCEHEGKRLGSFRKAWKTAVRKAGMPGLLLHDARRSFVRNGVRAQVPEKTVMAISGHKTRAVFDRYNIVSENDVVNAGHQLDAKFGHSLGTGCTKTVQASSAVH
jgi:integrase